MSTVEEYHKSARDCLRWAARARTEEQRRQFLSLASDWTDAAVGLEGALGPGFLQTHEELTGKMVALTPNPSLCIERSGVKPMHQYRIYTFRDDGHFAAVKRLECANEKQAVQEARQLVDGQNAELWESEHLIARFPDC